MKDYTRFLLFGASWILTFTICLFCGLHWEGIHNKPFYFIVVIICFQYMTYEYTRLYFRRK